jgi:hypothetical protein
MRAQARRHEDFAANKRRSKRKLIRTAEPPPPPPPAPPANPNTHYEAAWSDSWQHRRCMHKHRTLIEAARCAQPRGCGWYVFAVENDEGRQLSEEEDEIVNGFRFRR